ncbi:MAG TPA: ATP-binding protein [Burkholderiaceae bacterium]|nr:ATP-binding protein [Burkholderiaceae bacterium]
MTPAQPPRAVSLQRQLLTAVLGLLGVVWVVMILVTWQDTEHEVSELLDAHLSQAASLLAVLPLDDLTRLDFQETPELHEYQSKAVFQVWHNDQMVVRSATAPTALLAPLSCQGMSKVRAAGEDWWVFCARGRDEHVVVQVADRDKARADVVMASVWSVVWPMALAFPFVGLGVWGAVRHAVHPLAELGQMVTERRPDADDPLPLARVPHEARPLVLALNRLFERMNVVLHAERRFTADAAHELRTPIAAIRMQAQVAQGALDAEERNEALAATLTGCDRASHLVEQLLQLARLEALADATGEGCDLRRVLDWVLGDLRPVAARRGQTLHCEVTPSPASSPLGCPVPEGLMVILLRNLVDNALRYSPDGSQVRVQVDVDAHGQRRLAVDDNGPGMSSADLQRLGERFFRVVGSAQPGSGLGWSIVRRVAGLYGLQGQVMRSPDLGGLRVTFCWKGIP